MPAPIRALFTITIAASLLTACAPTTQQQQPQPSKQPRTLSAPATIDQHKPIVAGNAQGIETHTWLTDDTDNAVARALAPYLDNPLPVPPATAETWRAEGLRIVAVPTADLANLQSKLPPTRNIRRDWVGTRNTWTEVLRGRRLTPSRRISFDSRPQTLGPGTLRFLSRAWIVPQPPNQPAARVELAVQVARPPTNNSTLSLNRPTTLPTEDTLGPVLQGLTLAANLPPQSALVITAAPPAENWHLITSSPNTNDEPSPTEPTQQSPTQTDPDNIVARFDNLLESLDTQTPPRNALFGPDATPVRSLGVSMLTATDPADRPIKAILVIVPRLPETYHLLTPPPPRNPPQ